MNNSLHTNCLSNKLRFFFPWLLFIIIEIFSTTLFAEIKTLKGIPESKITLGDTFVESWLSFRKDMDSLDYAKNSPSIVEAWLDNAPLFLLYDIARLGRSPLIVYESLKRIIDREGKSSVSFVKEISKRFIDTGVFYKFAGLYMVLDSDELLKLQKEILSPSKSISLIAASILAAGNRREGFESLKAFIQKCDNNTSKAASVFGEMGLIDEIEFLEAEVGKGCNNSSLKAAIGEIFFKTVFPVQYKIMLRRDPLGYRYKGSTGLYSVWMRFYTIAYKHNIKTGWELVRFIKSYRVTDSDWPDKDKILIRRDLDSFSAFLKVANSIAVNKQKVIWPQKFSDAKESIKLKSSSSSELYEKRVTSAISLLSNLSENISHINIAKASIVYSAITTHSTSINDDNFATAFYSDKSGLLEIVLDKPQFINSIYISSGCFDNKKSIPDLMTITIIADNQERSFSIKPQGFYFVSKDINMMFVNKVKIEIKKREQSIPACITELKLSGN
jgi:hypothetical protein